MPFPLERLRSHLPWRKPPKQGAFSEISSPEPARDLNTLIEEESKARKATLEWRQKIESLDDVQIKPGMIRALTPQTREGLPRTLGPLRKPLAKRLVRWVLESQSEHDLRRALLQVHDPAQRQALLNAFEEIPTQGKPRPPRPEKPSHVGETSWRKTVTEALASDLREAVARVEDEQVRKNLEKLTYRQLLGEYQRTIPETNPYQALLRGTIEPEEEIARKLDQRVRDQLSTLSDRGLREGLLRLTPEARAEVNQKLDEVREGRRQRFRAYMKGQTRGLEFSQGFWKWLGIWLGIDTLRSAASGDVAGAVINGLQAALFAYYHKTGQDTLTRMEVESARTLQVLEKGADPSKSTLPDQPAKKWSVLFYIDGANNLHAMEQRGFDFLRKVGSDENVNLVAQMSTYGTTRGFISANQGLDGKYDYVSEHLGMQDMADPQVLKQYLLWAMKKFPAEHFAVVMADHGGGFVGSMTDDFSKNHLSNKDLGRVLEEVKRETGREIELVNFNACLMSQMEALYDLRKGTRYVVASQEVEAATQIPVYRLSGTTPEHKVMEDLKKGIQEKGDISAEELGKLYVYETKHQFGSRLFAPTQSLIKLRDDHGSPLEELKDSVHELASALVEAMKADPGLKPRLQEHIRKTQHYLNFDMSIRPYKDYRDLGHFAQRLAQDKSLTNPRLKALASRVLDHVQNAVVTEFHKDDSFTRQPLANSHGISIWLPEKYSTDYNTEFSHHPDYATLDFARDTAWDEFLKAVSNDQIETGKQNRNLAQLKNFGVTIAQINPYFEALTSLAYSGAHGFSVWNTILDPIGGYVRLKKAAKKFEVARESHWSIGKKAKFYMEGMLEGAMGVSFALLPFAWAFAPIFPVAMAGVGIGLTRTVYGLGKAGVSRLFQKPKSVEEKLAAV